ncbi:flagellin [Leminorella grimontii]|uniref:Flagellin n=1 Tax=Leminorella grimontii TaxID=82981 RepID=A0AAV5N196_9GAMM|nr:lateral flagellin LafA [Leminorella grimontii]KFC93569.1 FlaA family flagellin protein [Leminorella grimontii ATCC 33999 = DSM 5078]GKX55735.1 flagellin [Leminorella grimontii]GKX59544.1 flagellin [Leminorella grimontii]VFS55260.1 Flagellin C [Leminorella grimontii]
MLSMNTNAASMASVNAINKSNASLATSMERLATGNRINSSADDAAGKQIANRLTAQSSGMAVAQRNISDATAMLQTADGMFDEMNDILGRMKDLSTQAANGTYSDDDRAAMQSEFDELGQQMSDMLQNTTYGGTNLFNKSASGLFTNTSGVTFQVGSESTDQMTVNISSQIEDLATSLSSLSAAFSSDYGTDGAGGTVSGGSELMTSASATDTISAIQGVMSDIGKIQSTLGASINRLNDTAANLQNMQDNTEVAIGNIMDTDYATEASNMTKQQVLMQTGITMLKQSNSMSSMVSSLLQ